MKYIGYMAELDNAEVAIAAVILRYLSWKLESEEDLTNQAN